MCFGAADNHCTHCFLTEGFFTLLFANSSSLCFKFFALNQKALFFFFFPKPKYCSQKWKRSAGAVLPGRFVGAVVPQLCSQHSVAQPGTRHHRVPHAPAGAPTLPFTQEQRCPFPAASPLCSHSASSSLAEAVREEEEQDPSPAAFSGTLHVQGAQGDGTGLSCGSRGCCQEGPHPQTGTSGAFP